MNFDVISPTFTGKVNFIKLQNNKIIILICSLI